MSESLSILLGEYIFSLCVLDGKWRSPTEIAPCADVRIPQVFANTPLQRLSAGGDGSIIVP